MNLGITSPITTDQFLKSMGMNFETVSTQMKGIRFTYKNEVDAEEISKVFPEDTRGNRCDFLNLVASNMMNYSSEAAHAFLVGLDNEQFTVEVV